MKYKYSILLMILAGAIGWYSVEIITFPYNLPIIIPIAMFLGHCAAKLDYYDELY